METDVKERAIAIARERIRKVEESIHLIEEFPNINANYINVFEDTIFINVDREEDLRAWEKFLQEAGWERVGYPSNTPLTTSLRYRNSVPTKIELVMPNELFWRR